MKKIGFRIILIGLILAAVGLVAVGEDWTPGMFWRWEGTNTQSPSAKAVITIYVLTATKVLDATAYVLGQINRFPDTSFVTLGEVMRQHDYPPYGFGVQFQHNNLWRLNPPGWESKRTWSCPDDGTGTTVRRVEADDVTVTVPAGTYWHCRKLVEHYQVTHPDMTVDETDTTWYSTEIDWPVKMVQTSTVNGVTYTGTMVLVEADTIAPAEAARQLLAAIDEMEARHAVPSADVYALVYALRRKLLSLGLLPVSPP